MNGTNGNSALRFDGNNDYIFLGNVDTIKQHITQQFSVEAWVKPAAFQRWGTYIGVLQDNGGFEKGWLLGTANNRFAFALSTTGADDGDGVLTYLTARRDFDPNLWYHVAGTYDGTTMRLYVNGELQNTSDLQSGAINYPAEAEFVLGAYKDSNKFYPYHGQLAEVRLGTTVRSEGDLKAAMFTRLQGNEPGLIGYWPLNEGTGSVVYDRSGHELHGRFVDYPAWQTADDLRLTAVDTAPAGNQVLTFNGQNQYVEVPYAEALNPAQFTVTCWAKVTGGQGAWRSPVTSRDDIAADGKKQRGYIIYAGANNRWQFWIGNGGGWTGITGPAVELNKWTHVAATYDGTSMKLYINGALAAEGAGNMVRNTTKPLRIGAGASERAPTYFFNGQIDAVSIWNQARSAEAIQGAMNRRLAGNEPGLAGYWNFNEGTGTALTDLGSGGHNGAISGAGWLLDDSLVFEKLERTYEEDSVPVTPPETSDPGAILDLFADGLLPEWGLMRRLREGIKDNALQLAPDILGDFNVFDDLTLGLVDLFIEIRDPKLVLKEGEPGMIGEPGREITGEDDLAVPEKTKLVLSGVVSFMGEADVAIEVTFWQSKTKPKAALKLSLPKEGEANPEFGIGQLFPDIPLISGMKWVNPTFVITNAELLYDPGFDAGIEAGINYYANFNVGASTDEIWQLIGELLQVQELAVHAAVVKQKSGYKYVMEAAFRRNVTIISGENFEVTYTRSDISLALEGTPPEPSITLASDVVVSMKEIGSDQFNHLVFTGGNKLETESITGFFTMNGTGRSPKGALSGEKQSTGEWREPLGIPGLVIRQLSLQLGLTYATPWIDNVGVAGNLKLGDYDGSMGVLVDVNDPDQFVIAGHTDRITLLQILAAMTPATFVAYNALPSGLKSQLNNIVDVALEDVKVNIVPKATQIGMVLYRDEGVTIAGRLNAWGWQAEAFVNVDYADGVTVRAEMDPINILDGVFVVSGAQGDPKPVLDFALGPTRRHLEISAYVSLLGLSQELVIQFNEQDGLYFMLERNVGSILRTNLTCAYGNGRLAASGSLNFNLNLAVGPISIAGVKVIDRLQLVDVGLNASASLTITDAPSFALSFGGSFHFWGLDLDTGTISLNASPDDFQAIYDATVRHIIDNAADIFREIFANAWRWAQAIGEGIIQFAGDAAAVIKDVFNETAQVAAQVMGVMKRGVQEIANGLRAAYGLAADGVAQALKYAGYAANQIAQGLQAAYNLTKEAAAQALRAAGFVASEVASAMKGVWVWTTHQAAQALRAAGYAAKAVGNALKGTFTNAASEMAAAMRYAGYAAEEVGEALEDALDVTAETAAKALKYAGYGLNEVGRAMESAFNVTAQGMAVALKGAGYAVNEVGVFMKDVGGYADTAVNAALEGAGYAAGEVANFMSDVFGGSWIPHVDFPHADIPHWDHFDIPHADFIPHADGW